MSEETGRVKLLPGAVDFLKLCRARKGLGYDLRLFVLSKAVQYQVDLLARHFGIAEYFDGLKGVDWASGPGEFTKDGYIASVVGAAFHEFRGHVPNSELGTCPRNSLFIAIGGDSASDMEVAAQLAGKGYRALAFGVPTGFYDAEKLRKAGAAAVFGSLEEGPQIIDFFEGIYRGD